MATNQERVLQLLDRALADPAFLKRLMADPLGVAQVEGVQVSTADLKRWLRLPAATSDGDLLDLLRARLAVARPALEQAPVDGLGTDRS